MVLNYDWKASGYRFYDEVTGEDVATATVAEEQDRLLWKVTVTAKHVADWTIPDFREHGAMLNFLAAFWQETKRRREDGMIQVPPIEYLATATTVAERN